MLGYVPFLPVALEIVGTIVGGTIGATAVDKKFRGQMQGLTDGLNEFLLSKNRKRRDYVHGLIALNMARNHALEIAGTYDRDFDIGDTVLYTADETALLGVVDVLAYGKAGVRVISDRGMEEYSEVTGTRSRFKKRNVVVPELRISGVLDEKERLESMADIANLDMRTPLLVFYNGRMHDMGFYSTRNAESFGLSRDLLGNQKSSRYNGEALETLAVHRAVPRLTTQS